MRLQFSNKDYHARSELSKSDLDLLAKSPLHYKNKEFKEQSKAMLLGSITHKLVLEPNDFKNEFSIIPQVDKRTKQGKELLAEFETNLSGKIAIESDIFDTAKDMANEVLAMRQTAFFLRDGKAEQSYFSELESVKVKCRPDFYNENLGLLVDLKTTSDASAKGFMSSVANFNYHMQAAFYTDIMRNLGFKIDKFLFIAVETKAPYYVGFYELDIAALEQGRDRYKELLGLYKWCVEHNNWYGYAKKQDDKIDYIQTLSLPTWKYYEAI
ncbi:exodeoxyribonuclease VIII [Campylobacter fetus]|uniref:PD-(D/E)XK nuclease-like domain-containing protein n=1 Tax=Campylobacter fetus TaxID=196 RepID=UPI0011C77114|nr:PD-(D/E)XK nuclease-like domain-containing protein [Campylobacter fetus]EAJ1232609.1 exodeoxyribonuclease VIII [Campylobacter fetus]EAK0414712.1 exodeoxyribonuclease VIII [Campylobacter fetus]TXF09172.1 exodeoxyribonuclease VIII [Campylobacter fetus subsp. fetus]